MLDHRRRTIVLPEVVVVALRAQQRRQKMERLAAGSRWLDSGHVFATTIGTLIEAAAVTQAFRRALARAGLPHSRRPTASRTSAACRRRSTSALRLTTLSPCDMCTGAILLYGIPRVVMGENATFVGGEDRQRSRGVEVINLDSDECKGFMAEFIARYPEIWNEDIGED